MVLKNGMASGLALTLALLLLAACSGEKGKVMPSATPSLTPRLGAAQLQLAYADGEGNVWLVNADGSGRKRLIESDRCPYAVSLTWSPTGDRLACRGWNPDSPLPKQQPSLNHAIVVVDVGGRILKEIKFVGSFAWSPTGRHLAYSVLHWTPPEVSARYYIADAEGNTIRQFDGVEGDIIWSPDGLSIAYNADLAKVVIYDVNKGPQRSLGIGIDRALAWVLDGKAMLVASQYQEGNGMGIRYEAYLLDLASGRMARLAQLDNGTPFWVSPDSQSAAFLSWGTQRTARGAEIHVLNLATLTITPIEGSGISYPSEYIPSGHVAFTRDHSQLYWADVKMPDSAIYRARTDGTGLTRLTTLPSIHMRFSSDLTMIAYVVGNPPTLWVGKIDGSGAIQIGPLRNTFAWRPGT